MWLHSQPCESRLSTQDMHPGKIKNAVPHSGIKGKTALCSAPRTMMTWDATPCIRTLHVCPGLSPLTHGADMKWRPGGRGAGLDFSSATCHGEKFARLVLLAALLLELALLLGGGVLVLLVLGDEVVHVGLGLGELHLVHALAGVPVEEGLAAEHGGELLGDALHHLLHAGGVAAEADRHLEALGRDVADGALEVVGDPLDEVGRVLVLHVEHLLVDLLGRHAAAEERARGEVAAVAGVGGGHHVLGIEHLLGELGHREGAVLLRATRRERCKSDHEEVEAGEGDHVDGELAEVAVELAGEAEAAGGGRHDGGDQVVEVTEGRGCQLESAEADVIEGLVVEEERLVRVLDELVHGEHAVVGLDDSVGHLGRREDRVGAHDTVGVLLADLGDEERAHAGAGAATERVGHGEALEAVAALGLLADDVEDGVDELGALGVVALGPVVAGARLAEDKVVRAEDLAEGARADGVHGAGLEVHEDVAGHIATARSLVVVHVDALQLEVGVAVVGAGGVNAVLIGDDLPELGADLVAALATLDSNDLTHG
mmetsp:Transcript_78078/g.155161  ORF Transcript_78078/g.155161 Transcript_78078/m.155161 type:complete len:543 (+) Transcript_78078:117-1745(+)